MRKTQNLNVGWRFMDPDGIVREVNLPHTWNKEDEQNGGNNNWRGLCRYERDLNMPEFREGEERVYFEFRGVNASAAVYLNDTKVCAHDGGYSTFRIDVTELLQEKNRVVVQVDNGVNDRVYPQKADFTFYGGIYRDVNLVVVNRQHFDMDHCGGDGIRITPKIRGQDGLIQIQTFNNLTGEEGEPETHIHILDMSGGTVASGIGMDCILTIPNVHLWNGIRDPYLYTAVARLKSHGEIVDEVQSRFGVRCFHADPDKGFFLNGYSYPLRGVSRHQDWKGLGNAITKEHHKKDMELIREIGANTIRLAHYQHDQYFYDLCDEYGVVVWAEIPYISEHMPNGRENIVNQMKELIVQNYNHPCIVCWGISNEITISTKDKKDMLDTHRLLNDLCHEMDPSRLTTLACYAMCKPFHPSAHITDLVSWNLYLGWYVPGLFLNDLWIKFFHFRYPGRVFGYSEYGCEAMPNLHSRKPRRGDNTEEYQAVYHEYMLRCFERNPYLWATHVWNMFDFGADMRNQGGEPGMNHKGLVTFDRKIKKDSFYLYKAYWNKEPFVYIAGRRRMDREETITVIKVYTNQPQIALYIDGSLAAEQTGDKIFEFRVHLKGTMEIEAKAGSSTDTAVFTKVTSPNQNYKLIKAKASSGNWVP